MSTETTVTQAEIDRWREKNAAAVALQAKRDAVKVPAKFAKDESARAGYINGAVEPRPLYLIAREIRKDWGAKINYAARPYLDALSSVSSITDMYGADSVRSTVAYFLANASTYRGGGAKHLKAELQAILDTAK